MALQLDSTATQDFQKRGFYMQLFVFIRKNTDIFEKQRHLCIFLDFHKTIMQQLESHQKDFPILSLTI